MPTLAYPQTTLMELHALGPAKLFDTAGVDERGELGAKKLAKTLATLKVCCRRRRGGGSGSSLVGAALHQGQC